MANCKMITLPNGARVVACEQCGMIKPRAAGDKWSFSEQANEWRHACKRRPTVGVRNQSRKNYASL